MSVRIMLPSKARVGDTIHFSFPNGPGKVIASFEVTINGQKVKDPEVMKTRGHPGNSAIFVFRAEQPGIHQFVITPIGQEGERGDPRMNTLEVTA
jgi:hypothetical protein